MQPSGTLTAARRLAALLLLATSYACGSEPKGEPASPPPEASTASAVEPSPGAAAAEEATEGEEGETPAKGTVVPVITPFGVPDCDNYVKKFMACVEGRVPEAQKENLLAAFEANRTKWRALASMREGALALGLACRAAAQKSKEELAVDYGCEF